MKRFLLLLFLALTALSCSERVVYTEVEIIDPVRHYYPILQGKELSIAVEVLNKGRDPLIIRDIQPSCGCITTESLEESIIIPPRRSYIFHLTYDSNKNVGRADHYIRFWGNILPEGWVEMRFDVNVVPDANYHHDYEELYSNSDNSSTLRHAVDGSPQGRGYYIDK